jgi:hypothetical protein
LSGKVVGFRWESCALFPEVVLQDSETSEEREHGDWVEILLSLESALLILHCYFHYFSIFPCLGFLLSSTDTIPTSVHEEPDSVHNRLNLMEQTECLSLLL